VGARSAEITKAVQLRPLKPDEIARMKQALQVLAQGGAFDPQLLQGYFDYLDEFGLEAIVDNSGAR
jgi:hypothetical protein